MKLKVGKRFRVLEGHPLAGLTGTVTQWLYRDRGRCEEAICTMDARVERPGWQWDFPADDPSGRGRLVALWGVNCGMIRR